MNKSGCTLTLMADKRGRWLWSHDMNAVTLPEDTIAQAEAWLEKFTSFCEHPDDGLLRWQFNPEGMNLARQVQLFLGPEVAVSYTAWHPARKVKRGQDEPVFIEYWADYSSDCCSEIKVHTPLSLIEFIMEMCEDSGSIADVGEGYYQQSINMDDEAMHSLIRHLIFSKKDYINDSDQWKTEDKLLDHLRSILLLIMRGLMYFPDDGGQPVFAKPTHMPTDEELNQLRERADNERGTILEVLWEILHEQAVRQEIA